MAYLGPVPSEHSSGGRRRQGGITKAGNGTARRKLIETAWTCRFPARISRDLLLRLRETAWKSQTRLCGGYRKLSHTGKLATIVRVAIALQLSGFVSAIAKHVQAAAA